MVRLRTLDPPIGVRLPASQFNPIHAFRAAKRQPFCFDQTSNIAFIPLTNSQAFARYEDLPSMTVGLMSVNLGISARTSAMRGFSRAAFSASGDAN